MTANKKIQISYGDLFSLYLEEGYDDIMSFPDYMEYMSNIYEVIEPQHQ